MPPPSSSSSLLKIASGASLVANAVLKEASKEAAVVASRASKHGGDLWTKGSSSTASTMVVPAATTAFTVLEQVLHNINQNIPENQPEITVKAGTAPYESQLRKRREKMNMQEMNEESALNGQQQQSATVTTTTIDQYEPYLFHATAATTSTIETAAAAAPLSPSRTTSSTNETQLPTTDNDNDILNAADGTSTTTQQSPTTQVHRQHLQEGQAVPATRIGRAFGFARLGVGLMAGTVGEGFRRAVGGSGGGSTSTDSILHSDANADRLAATLCRMRGAALKLGQMLSIQDETLLPPALTRALQQVRQGAEAMPAWQLHSQLKKELGEDWREKFTTFDDMPFAAASIGQVHYAEIEIDTTIQPVVVKVQYPGVADSINSDLGNLAMLFRRLAPKGLFLDNVIRVGRDELQVECQYENEAANQDAMRELVESDLVLRQNKVHVPKVFDHLSTNQVLTTTWAPGHTIDNVLHASQEERNRIGRTILYLTMQELFEWRLMQTDPNWGNFLYDAASQTTTLIDFGATRSFPKEFVDGYLRIVWASANQEEETLFKQSYKMGFLTGDENDAMLEAHKWSGFTVGEPFYETDKPFDFQASQISSRMGEHTSVFLKHRLTPPPEEVYTLHRKLAGAYMLCIKLGAVIECRDMLEAVVRNHQFEDGMPNPITGA